MKILLLFMVCEKDKSIAKYLLDQLVDLCGDIDLHMLIYDDGSESHLGDTLRQEFADQITGQIEVIRSPSNRGYYRLQQNLLKMLRHTVASGVSYDFVMKIDPDVHFTDRRWAQLLDLSKLPPLGITGPIIKLRKRELVQIVGDLMPIGFRRRKINGQIDHKWQWRFYRKVWWRDIGWRAIFRKSIRYVAPGSCYLLAWESVIEMSSRGYFDRDHEEIGLIFAEDFLLTILTTSLGHPVTALSDIDPQFKCDIYIDPSSSVNEIREQNFYYIHPLKSTPEADQLRRSLPLE